MMILLCWLPFLLYSTEGTRHNALFKALFGQSKTEKTDRKRKSNRTSAEISGSSFSLTHFSPHLIVGESRPSSLIPMTNDLNPPYYSRYRSSKAAHSRSVRSNIVQICCFVHREIQTQSAFRRPYSSQVSVLFSLPHMPARYKKQGIFAVLHLYRAQAALTGLGQHGEHR